MTLAWFTPWPPQTTGVAGRSREIVSGLAARGYGIDVFVDERQVTVRRIDETERPAPGAVRVASAHDFVWRAGRGHYDLVVYQMGNSRLHEFIWPYLLLWPGLVVLHDARLHHARAAALITRGKLDAYRAEFAWNHPDLAPGLSELAIAAFDGPYYYQWPMMRTVVDHARLVAVHARGAVRELERTCPGRDVMYIALGEGIRDALTDDARRAARARLGIPPHAVLVGVYGALTPAKRIPEILRAFSRTHRQNPLAHLLLCGPNGQEDWGTAAENLGIPPDAVTSVDAPDDETFDAAIAAADVTLHLRWPTSLETSGPWLRALSAGRATITTELEHHAHVPALDPRTWQPWAPGPDAPVTVAIDILDEDHSLALALRRLVADEALRTRLGTAARAYWAREHAVSIMLDGYERAIAQTVGRPVPVGPGTPGLASDPFLAGRAHVEPFGDVNANTPER